MMSSARERSIVLLRMSYIEDPFDRDDLSQAMPAQGNRFIKSRSIAGYGASQRHRKPVQEILKLVGQNAPRQLEAISRMSNDELDAATELFQMLSPVQDKIIIDPEKFIGNYPQTGLSLAVLRQKML